MAEQLRKSVKGLPIQPRTRRHRVSGTFYPDGFVEISSGEEEYAVNSILKRKKCEENKQYKRPKKVKVNNALNTFQYENLIKKTGIAVRSTISCLQSIP